MFAYNDIILDYSRQPKNYGELEDYTWRVEGFNPLCGDKIELYAKISNGLFQDLKFTASACAICIASTSLLTDKLINQPVDQFSGLFEKVHKLMTQDVVDREEFRELGKIRFLKDVKSLPMRVKCAMLPWQAVKKKLLGQSS